MKIPLKVSNEGRLMPNQRIIVFGQRSNPQFKVLVDTGSEVTIISYKDAILLQIPIRSMEIIKTIQGISNDRAGLAEYKKPLKLLFKTDEGTIHKITSEKTYISKENRGANITIIGMDFLQENNMSLYYDPNGEAYLKVNQ